MTLQLYVLCEICLGLNLIFNKVDFTHYSMFFKVTRVLKRYRNIICRYGSVIQTHFKNKR